MKILHLIDSAGYYGAEATIISLALEQKKIGDLPVICGIVKSGQTEPDIVIKARKLGLESVALRLDGGLFHQGKLIVYFAQANSISVIHSHGYRPGILLGIQLGRFKGLKIRTLHGWTHSKMLSKLYLYNLVDSLLLWRQDAVVVVSEKMKSNKLLSFVPKSLVTTVNNGISISEIKSKKIDDLQSDKFKRLCEKYFLIGAVGRLSAEKAQSDMIKSVAILREKGCSVALVIIGEGGERSALEKLAHDMNISEYVCLPGYLDNAASYIPLFDVLCMSSITEGLPITVLEAMAQGVPVISTDVGEIPILLSGEKGLLVKPRDPVGISDAVEKLLENSELSKTMTGFARDYFLKHHSSKIMAEHYNNVYKRANINKGAFK